MRPLRIYADTSVLGGCLDPEFSEHSARLIEQARSGRIRLLLSEVVLAELLDAPPDVHAVLRSLPPASSEHVPVTEEVLALRDAYLMAGIIEGRWLNDAAHVAAATVARADAIVSWNFRHIVRLDKIKAYNQVNLLNGYGILTILSPREVALDESDTRQKDL